MENKKNENKDFDPVEYLEKHDDENISDMEDFSLFDSDSESGTEKSNPFMPKAPESVSLEPLKKSLEIPTSTISVERKKVNPEQYLELKKFLKEQSFKLIGDIDFVFDGFQFAFEAANFVSTLEVKNFFEKSDFFVELVCYRDYSYKNSTRPLLKDKRRYKDGKKFYDVRVLVASPFFEQIHDYDSCRISSDEEEPEGKVHFMSVGTFLAFLLVFLFSAAIILTVFSTPKSKSNFKSAAIEYPRAEKKIVVDDDLVMPIPADLELEREHREFYDITFNTVDGVRVFYNADYDTQHERVDIDFYCVTTFDEKNEAYKWDYINVNDVKSISKTLRRK